MNRIETIQNKYKRLIILIILIITPVVSFCLDEYVASLPHMVHELNSTTSYIQLSVTIYILALGLSQWFFGLLSDRYGRRPIFNVGGSITLIGTIICVFSQSSNFLLVGRFVQGFGMGSAATTFAALTGDVFEGNELNRVASYTTFVYGMVPIVAPLIGGYVQTYFGWRENFILMFFIVLAVSIFVLIKLPETHRPNHSHRLELERMFKDYAKILTNRNYIGAVSCLIFSWTFVIAFSIVAPFILQFDMNFSPAQYGHVALLIGIAYLIGNSLSSFLIKRMPQKNIMIYSVILIFIGSLILFCLSFASALSWISFILPIFIIIFGVGLLFPCAYGMALSAFTNLAGLAGSLIGTFMCFGAVLLTLIISGLGIVSFLYFSLVYLILAIMCFISLSIALSKS